MTRDSVVRHRWWVLGAWLIAATVGMLALPSGSAWAQDDPEATGDQVGQAIDDLTGQAEAAAGEVVEDAEAAAAAAAKAAEEAIGKLAEFDGFFVETDDEDADPVLKDGVAELMGQIPMGDMPAEVFAAAVKAEVIDPFEEAEISEEMFTTNNLWIMLAGCLVFIMHLGFAMVESGLTRAKNTVNILFKNVMIVMIGIVMYGVCGWLIMYPGGGHEESMFPNVFDFGFGIGAGGAFYSDGYDYQGITPLYNTGYTVWTDFFFQAMFAATAATIVSGAVAGRIKLLPFLIFSTLFVGILYPTTGSWEWGEGWLDDMGFADFAGSSLVHAVGGFGALAGALVLGPRLGKYAKDGTLQPIPGHNMPLVTIGVFLLWFGWFGFNGGSELSAYAPGVSYVLVTTTMAACGGGLAAAAVSWIVGGKPDLTMALNGILAGLVGITAGPDTASWIEALLGVGAISGVIVYFSVITLDKLRIDDPVGAISVHGVCGIYGTLCVAIWGDMSMFGVQLIGTLAISATAFVFALIVFSALKFTIGLRVSEEEEIEGLDLGEHDASAYPDFQRTYIKSYHAREI